MTKKIIAVIGDGRIDENSLEYKTAFDTVEQMRLFWVSVLQIIQNAKGEPE